MNASIEWLESAETEEVLRHFAGRRVAVSTAFGPGGVVLIDLVQRMGLDFRVYFIDTLQHFPETLGVLEQWRDRGVDIEVYRPGLHLELARGDGRLWRHDPDRCCHLRKVLPNGRALAQADVWMTALRRDQPGRSGTPVHRQVVLPDGHAIEKVAPLARWSGQAVWDVIEANALPYNPLHDRGFPSVGCTPCTTRVAAGGAERDGRWAGREKTECGLHLEEVGPEPRETAW